MSVTYSLSMLQTNSGNVENYNSGLDRLSVTNFFYPW